MAGLNDIAKESQLNPAKCEHCHKRFSMSDVLDDFFKRIIARVATGQRVRIKDFGTFYSKLFKGRKLKSPLIKGGEIEFGDSFVLRFHQSTVAKKRLNAMAEAAQKKTGKKAKKKTGKKAKKKTGKKAKKKTGRKITTKRDMKVAKA